MIQVLILKSFLGDIIHPITVMVDIESQIHMDLMKKLCEYSFEQFTTSDMHLALCKINLQHYHEWFVDNALNGKKCTGIDVHYFTQNGFSARDASLFLFNRNLMSCSQYPHQFDTSKTDCPVCSHDSIESTLELLEELSLDVEEFIRRNNWTMPCLVTFSTIIDEFNILSEEKLTKLREDIKWWKEKHQEHLEQLSSNEARDILIIHPPEPIIFEDEE